MYENYSIVFSNSAGSDVLQMETTTYVHILYGTNSIIVWMCVVWPRVHTLKDYDYRIKNGDSFRCWRYKFCPCKVRNIFIVKFLNSTIHYLNNFYCKNNECFTWKARYFTVISCWNVLRWEISQKNNVQEIKDILCPFFRNCAFLWDNVERYGIAGTGHWRYYVK
jgi:hypothetical protein